MQSKITKKETAVLPTEYGEFDITVFEDGNGLQHTALTKNIDKDEPALVRLHSECLTGDAFHSLKCDCRKQLETALTTIGKDSGIILYLRQEGRGIGLLNKIKAYDLQDRGMDTVEANEHLGFKADERTYDMAAQMLADLGINRIKLLTNNPKKIEELEKNGITVTERVPLVIESNPKNKEYLKVKKEKLGHQL